ncbi:MAG: Hsp33 family molecular chaperone HslO, partial [Ruminococcus sp.]|nr:Hsp33 family molecular chaperone HslO [Ruminococcus sp.]
MDKIIRCITSDGAIMASAIDASDIVFTAKKLHNLSRSATAALGRLLCATSMMGNMLKQQDALINLRVLGDGEMGAVVAVGDSRGNVRGYVENPGCPTEYYRSGKINVSQAVGRNGTLSVLRDYGTGDPYIGQVELVSGEIAEDLTAYLLESEQVPSACALGVLVDTDRTIRAAGGFIVQLMPGADEELIGRLEENILLMDQLTTVLDEDGPEAVFAQVLKGMEYHLVGEAPVGYRCPCSRERVEEA